ncbi:MAG: hypothetical protein PVH19_06860 [Planctomycetia bacterium]|jgi:hypothetical protein
MNINSPKAIKTGLLLVVLFCIPITTYAREDAPLKWKLQRWEYIVLVQVGEEVGTEETKHLQNNVITVLRGDKKKLPKFEWWGQKNRVKGQYYLMCYHKTPPGTSAWQSFPVEKSKDGLTVQKFYTDHDTVFYGTKAKYKDMTFGQLEEVLKKFPFEPDVTKSEFYKHGMIKKPDPLLLELKNRLEPELQKLSPKPTVEFYDSRGGGGLSIRFDTRNYVVHPSTMSRGFLENTVKKEGPNFRGFILGVSFQPRGTLNQLATPQVLREPYWDTYINIYPIKNTQQQFYFRLSYSTATNKALIDKIKKAAEQLQGEVTAKVMVTPKRKSKQVHN